MKKLRKLSRKRGARISLVKNLATSLIFYEKIETTLAKAKMASSYVERIFRQILALKKADKDESLTIRRLLIGELSDRKAVKKIFDDILNRLGDRKNGFCRIVKLPKKRVGDNAQMVQLSLILEAPKLAKIEEKVEEKKS